MAAKKNDKQYSMYKGEGRYSRNKKRKLERHLKKFPQDEVAMAALKNVASYKRKAPKSEVWNSFNTYYAQTLSEFGYSANTIMHECFYKRRQSSLEQTKHD